MPNYLPDAKVTELRKCYDDRMTKNAASKKTGIAEATVYRYYVKWKAHDETVNSIPEILDLRHLPEPVLYEIKIQAGIRRMTPYNFVFSMLSIIAKDNLFRAIMDTDEGK